MSGAISKLSAHSLMGPTSADMSEWEGSAYAEKKDTGVIIKSKGA